MRRRSFFGSALGFAAGLSACARGDSQPGEVVCASDLKVVTEVEPVVECYPLGRKPVSINVGVFLVDGKSSGKTLFLGTMKDFRRWEWPRVNTEVMVRVRSPGIMPIQAIFRIDEDLPPPSQIFFNLVEDGGYGRLDDR